jgi:predicted aconitase with swiveling domain
VTVSIKASGVNMLKERRSVTAETLVFNQPINLNSFIDFNSGAVKKKGHAHEGKSIKNKIIVAPSMSFDSDLEYLIYLLSKNQCSPRGIIVKSASSNLILGAVLADIPIIHGLEKGKLELISGSKKVTMDLEKGAVKINK